MLRGWQRLDTGLSVPPERHQPLLEATRRRTGPDASLRLERLVLRTNSASWSAWSSGDEERRRSVADLDLAENLARGVLRGAHTR